MIEIEVDGSKMENEERKICTIRKEGTRKWKVLI